MAKNIEMSVLGSDGSYEVLYPYTIPSQVEDLLNNDTKVYIGLNENSTPDDAFRQLFLANVLQNKSSLRIILQNQDGIRMGGVALTSEQFCDSKGNKTPSMITNDEGIIDTFTDGETTTVNISGYFEIANTNTSWTTPLGEQLEETWTITTRNELTVTTTKNFMFTNNVSKIDICTVGGGGGGGGGGYGEYFSGGGSGGGGGYSDTILNYTIQNLKEYNIIIGAGGAGGIGYSSYTQGGKGRNGGTTSFNFNSEVILSSIGGNGGNGGNYLSGQQIVSGGVGNGNGGLGDSTIIGNGDGRNTAGTNGTIYKFNDINLGLAGGGGGGGASYNTNLGNATPGALGLNSPLGGVPYGGNASKYIGGTDVRKVYGDIGGEGIGPGGGGGGGGGNVKGSISASSGRGGNGGAGIIYLRWTVQEVSA